MLLEFQVILTDLVLNVKKHNKWHHFACKGRDDKALNNWKVMSGGSVKKRSH